MLRSGLMGSHRVALGLATQAGHQTNAPSGRAAARALAGAALAALALSCAHHSGLQPAEYVSGLGILYYWDRYGSDGFRRWDIEAVEAAAFERGLCKEPPRVSWVAVRPEPFQRIGCGPAGCHGWHPGWIEVVGGPKFCAGESALLHELFHACVGDPDHRDPRWPLADKPVPCGQML